MRLEGISPLAELRERLDSGAVAPVGVAREFGARANGNALGNTYLRFDFEELVEEARELKPGGPLYGVPVSIKDCFDVAGTLTTAGSGFYARANAVASRDSAVAARLREGDA